MQKSLLSFDPLGDQSMCAKFNGEKICFSFCNEYQSSICVDNIEPSSMLVGENDQDMGSYICELSHLTISYLSSAPEDIVQMYVKDPNNIPNLKFRRIKVKVKKSLVFLLKKLGDLDLFFLVVSHLIKKINEGPILLKMLQEVFTFLENIVQAKNVKGKVLNVKEN